MDNNEESVEIWEGNAQQSQLHEERENTLLNPKNINIYYIFTQQHQKWVFPAAHTLSNPKNDFPVAHTFNKTQNEFPAMGKMVKSTKVVKGNTQELPDQRD